jgi:hypothetical protein
LQVLLTTTTDLSALAPVLQNDPSTIDLASVSADPGGKPVFRDRSLPGVDVEGQLDFLTDDQGVSGALVVGLGVLKQAEDDFHPFGFLVHSVSANVPNDIGR